jgi:hypothetical protein
LKNKEILQHQTTNRNYSEGGKKMTTKHNSLTLKKVGDREEIFVLRAQDASAPRSVILWIADNLHASDEKLRDAFECALRMRKHPKTKAAD